MEIFHIKCMTENKIFLRKTAILVAGSGLKVFPCHTLQDGKCTCSDIKCKNPGKHPRIVAGVSGSTTDKNLVEVWWSPHLYWGDSNVGIITRTDSLEYIVVNSTGEAELPVSI